MDGKDTTSDRPPVSGDHRSPPEEPFAYLSNSPGFAVRSPVGTIIVYVVFTCFGLWAIWAGAAAYTREGAVGGLVMSIAGIAAAAGGPYVIYMAVRRLQWKREYERVTGRSPW